MLQFMKTLNGEVRFPVSTDDLTRLVERDTDDLDLYADLSSYGPAVEGLTGFRGGKKPIVKISADLAGESSRENRLRTTLTHEFGHVHFHAYLWELPQPGVVRSPSGPTANMQVCKRDTILEARQSDWMEWQAGYACGALLMPLTYVRRLVTSYQEAHGVQGCIALNSEHGRGLIAETQKAFQVSPEAARVRLLKLGFVYREGAAPSLFDVRPAA
jgi:IrrE N-terminal-like domain